MRHYSAAQARGRVFPIVDTICEWRRARAANSCEDDAPYVPAGNRDGDNCDEDHDLDAREIRRVGIIQCHASADRVGGFDLKSAITITVGRAVFEMDKNAHTNWETALILGRRWENKV